ncbi:MAG TPA: DUF2721 domain-containing protein [Gemmatimonadaceae bacterium]|nr:DUF2721 domain-containing protein [Gemmatimonadaceae bacterium]
MMQLDTPISGLAHTIQLSVAPVFLLSGVGAFLGVLTNRLARIIDRTRIVQAARPEGPPAGAAAAELAVLRGRARLINRAIGLCTASAVLVASVVAAIFVGAIARIDLTMLVASTFVAAMVSLIAGLLSFLREIHLLSRHMRATAGRP